MFQKCLAGVMVFFLTACSLQDVSSLTGNSSSADGTLSTLVDSLPEKSLLLAFNQTSTLDGLLSDAAKTIKKVIKELESDPTFAEFDLAKMAEEPLTQVKDGGGLPFEKLSFFLSLKPGISVNMDQPEALIEEVCVSVKISSQHEAFDDLMENASMMAESTQSKNADFSISRSTGKLELSSGCTGVAVPDFESYAEYEVLFAEKQFFSAVQALSKSVEMNSEIDSSSIKKIAKKLENQLEKLNFNKVRLGTLGQVMSLKLSDNGYQFEQFERLASKDLQTLRYDFWNGKAQSEKFYLNESASFEFEVLKEDDNAVYRRFEYENLDWTHLISLLEKQGLGGILTMSVGAGLVAGAATFSRYMAAAKNAESQAAVRNASTIIKTARAVDNIDSFTEDVNGDGQFSVRDIEKMLSDEGGYSLPKLANNKCYFYGYSGEESEEFVVLVGKKNGKPSSYRNQYIHIDGTPKLRSEVSASVQQDVNCIAPKMSGITWINLSQGGGTQVMDLSTRSGGLIDIKDNPRKIRSTPSASNGPLSGALAYKQKARNTERKASVRNAATIMKVAQAVASIDSYKQDVDGSGRFDAKDIQQVLQSEGRYTFPEPVGDQCYFYMVSDLNDNEFAVFVGAEDQSVLVDGTSKMIAAVEKLFTGKALNCELPSIPGGTVLNLSQ